MFDPMTGLILQGAMTGATALGSYANPYARENRKRIAELRARDRAGTLGLTGEERDAMSSGQLEALRTTTTQGFNDMARLDAASGGAMSAADVARARNDMSRQMGEGARRVARDVQAESLRRADAQRSELQDRMAVEQQRNAALANSFYRTLEQGAAVMGKMDGSVPELWKASGHRGEPVTDYDSFRSTASAEGLSDEEIAQLERLLRRGGDVDVATQIDAALRGEGDPELRALLHAMRAARGG